MFHFSSELHFQSTTQLRFHLFVAVVAMSTKKRKVYDPNPIHPANQQSLKQQQSSLRNFITKSQENQKSLITIKFEQQQHQPESQYIDLTTNHDDSTTNLSLITSTYNNNVHDNSWSVTIEQSSTSVTNGNNNNSNQPNNNTSHLVSTHNVSSYSVNSLDDSDYHCDFNLRDIKQQYKPNRPSPHRNQPSPPSPPPSKDNANIGDDQSGGKSGNHNESTTNHGGSSNDDDSIHDSDSDTEGGHTLHSESSRSEDTDSNISQEYSIITESLHYLDDASHHDEIVHCQQCNVITSVIIWDAR